MLYGDSAMLESNYVLEGRDELDGASFLCVALEFERELPKGTVLLGTWHGYSGGASYREGDFHVNYAVEFGNVTGDISYMLLQFYSDSDDVSDNELEVSLTWAPKENFQAGIEWYMSL